MVQKTNLIRLSKPLIPNKGIEDLTVVLKSGNLVRGAYTKQFENSLKEYLNVNHVFLVSSGTAALHSALLAMNIKPGEEVILPAFSFPATINVVELHGAKPVLVDISLETFCIDFNQIEEKISANTKAIMPVDEFGTMADMPGIIKLCDKHNLLCIEDSACALGSEVDNNKAGSMGDIGCFSFHPRKIITSGEGGAIVCNDENLAIKLNAIMNHGFSSSTTYPPIPGMPGLNYRLTDFQAALLLPQFNILDTIIKKRRKQAEHYNKLFGNHPFLRIPKILKHQRQTFQTYHIMLDKRFNRNRIIKLLRNKNIESGFGAHALHILPYFRGKYNFTETEYPNALSAFQQGLVLPLGHHIDEEIISCIANTLLKIMENYDVTES